MPIIDLFSKRKKRDRGEIPDVYVYDSVPGPLRVQIVHIISDALGKDSYSAAVVSDAFSFLHNTLAREYGLFRLAELHDEPHEALLNFFLQTNDHERALDVIELTFRYIERIASESEYRYHAKPNATATQAIDELNARLKEAGVGYEYNSGELVRVDSQFIHAAAVKPALTVLADRTYSTANAEFRSAHEHYRHARYEEALTNCLKAVESVLKVICDRRKWHYEQTDTAKRLIDIVFANGLVPGYLQSEFTALRSTLESGVPVVRNKQAAHGQGVAGRSIPRHLVTYVLHLTATTILFLAEAEKQL